MTSLTTPKETGRGADIPAPRGGQGVRLLVLGVDEDARLLRERAAAAGFELAQRYSARVSHVAYGAGVDPQDGRYAKIRDAGLALLPIQTCAAELGLAKPAEPPVPPVPAQAEPRLEERQPAREREPKHESEPASEPESDEFPEDDLLDEPGGPDPLAYPPLDEEEPGEPRPEELDPTAVALAAAAIGVDRWPTDFEVVEIIEVVETDEADEADEADESVEVEQDTDTAVAPATEPAAEDEDDEDEDEDDEDDETLEDIEVHEEVALVDPVIDGEAVAAPTPGPRLLVLSVVWALIPLISLGLLTPLAFGYAAVRTRSRLYAAATLGYALAVVLAFALSAEHPQPGSTANGTGGLLTFALALSWLGGTGHALSARTRVFGKG
ncbi:hypothetical protein [Actinospica robiniae]|uniref:hypothetical protein n=1 Tax=Actinospica robiniae TaxID=304901 RepID=UPI00040FB0DB|nr:hypothetical protein [Actinospica robiniae]